MKLIIDSPLLQHYLGNTEEINYNDPAITELVHSPELSGHTETERIERAFLFVRDKIAHSWDIQSKRITITATEVLLYKEGICYAKSNLLAALLRVQGIPAGFCYQRLTIGDTPDSGYCIHAMNAVYLSEHERWIRMDARGNKEGVHAEFSVTQDALAFPVRHSMGESEYPTVFAHPHTTTLAALRRNSDALHMYLHDLPTSL
ncbi:transglutaminase [Paenibacillus sp. FSL H8-0548]|uniref:transglutaminase-like domain-containing protein n=1 Tax=Paenibacillus sp. FSL H8-0548 TaxID=1920422 RepID=UPI00096DC6BC|nr:transglutaminase family protein [Paenibacillus sp. FSL H8-0548]OMF37747.1 transglutaminase [Paenibacillus sp. FSL H8-0548]